MYAAKILVRPDWQLARFYAPRRRRRRARSLPAGPDRVKRWETEILTFHVTGISNGPIEAQNLITEKLRRIAHGLRNFENYRLRLLLHSGVQWNTRINCTNQGPSPTAGRVEPGKSGATNSIPVDSVLIAVQRTAVYPVDALGRS